MDLTGDKDTNKKLERSSHKVTFPVDEKTPYPGDESTDEDKSENDSQKSEEEDSGVDETIEAFYNLVSAHRKLCTAFLTILEQQGMNIE